MLIKMCAFRHSSTSQGIKELKKLSSLCCGFNLKMFGGNTKSKSAGCGDCPGAKPSLPSFHAMDPQRVCTSRAPKLTFMALPGIKPPKLRGDVDFYDMPPFPSRLLAPCCRRSDNSSHPRSPTKG